MEEERVYSSKRLFRGIVADLKGRALCYKQDWLVGLRSGFGYLYRDFTLTSLIIIFYLTWNRTKFWYVGRFCRILAPTTYIFFASALPVIAFGEQLSRDTGLFPLNYLSQSSWFCVHVYLVEHKSSSCTRFFLFFLGFFSSFGFSDFKKISNLNLFWYI